MPEKSLIEVVAFHSAFMLAAVAVVLSLAKDAYEFEEITTARHGTRKQFAFQGFWAAVIRKVIFFTGFVLVFAPPVIVAAVIWTSSDPNFDFKIQLFPDILKYLQVILTILACVITGGIAVLRHLDSRQV